jgi:hypothetical protein
MEVSNQRQIFAALTSLKFLRVYWSHSKPGRIGKDKKSSIPGQSTFDLWCTKRQLNKSGAGLFRSISAFLCQYHSSNPLYSSSSKCYSYQKDKWTNPRKLKKNNSLSESTGQKIIMGLKVWLFRWHDTRHCLWPHRVCRVHCHKPQRPSIC